MSEYLATGRNAEGKKVTERVEAESADEAVRMLRDRGFEEIVLHTDDVSARYTRQSEVDETISPRRYLWFRDLPAPLAGFLVVALGLYRKSGISCLIALIVVGYRRERGIPWGMIDTLLLLWVAFPAVFALGAQFFRGAAAEYNVLIDAIAWGRWDEALRRAEALGARGGVPAEEIAFRKARALAGLGRFEDALRVVKPYGDGERMPPWLYWGRMAELYLGAKRYQDVVAAYEKAIALAPGNATTLLDLARAEVWYFRNPRRARTLLAEVRTHAISDVLKPFVTATEGLIRLEEGDPREARALLEEGYQGASAFRHASPLMGAMLDQMHTALALACADEGDTEAALRHYRLARPRLEALKLDDQIARCERALGLPHGGWSDLE